MAFEFDTAIPLLRRTPAVVRELLIGLPEPWIVQTEGPQTWNALDVVAHLIHGEQTDWIPRVEHFLARGDTVPFTPFDRHGHAQISRGRALPELLEMFQTARADSLARLRELRLSAADLERRGMHPDFGPVTLGQHLSTWVVHDLNHLMQISRVMAQMYRDAVGPWRRYLRIVNAGVSPS